MPEPAGWIPDFYAPGISPTEWTALAGGKGANLARLAQAGLPVPKGFILCINAYNEFVAANQLEEKILSANCCAFARAPSFLPFVFLECCAMNCFGAVRI